MTPSPTSVQRRPDKRWLTLIIIIVIAVVIIGVRLGPMFSIDNSIEGVLTISDLSREHREGPISYEHIPPLGGPHHAEPQNCGIYDQPIANENAVASLERGAVWIAYDPQLSPGDVERLRLLARGKSHVLMAPYPDLPHPVVMTAWGAQLQAKSVTDPRFVRFIGMYAQSKNAPEVGLPCSGGVGTPIE